LHRFFGFTVFAARPPRAVNSRDPGNATALQAVFPAPSQRGACVASLRQAPASALEGRSPALALCLASSPVPDVCFLSPADPTCEGALRALAEPLGDPSFPTTFRTQVLPACFQLGSMLEGGEADGDCYPAGQRDRAALESFMLAFDSNLKPMVGQQVTLTASRRPEVGKLLGALLRSAERGHCDAAARRNDRGYLVTVPNGAAPEASVLIDERGTRRTLGELRSTRAPITLTCYPPQPGQAEAARAAFGSGQRTRSKH